MTDRDRSAVHVRLLPRQAELLFNRKVLRRERLVNLDEIYLAKAGPGALHQFANGRRRSDPHDARFDASGCPVDQPPDRGDSLFLRPAASGHHRAACPVADAGGRASVNDAVLLENLVKLLQAFQGGVRPIVLVSLEEDGALLGLKLDWGDLRLEPPGFLCCGEAAL